MASNSEFWELYKHPLWQRKRLEIMQRDGFKCKCCGTEGETLNVHHAYYVRGASPWEYPDVSFTTLCDECHKLKHDQKETILTLMAHMDEVDAEKLIGYAMGILIEAQDFCPFTFWPKHSKGIADAVLRHSPADTQQGRERFEEAIDRYRGKSISRELVSSLEDEACELEKHLRDDYIDSMMHTYLAFNG